MQSSFNSALTGAIATQLATLPLISPTSGFTFKYDKAAGVFVPTSRSFGPIYTERAETIGRGRFSFGASYQRFRFGSIDGIDLHSFPAVFSHAPERGAPYESDFISTTTNFDVKMDQTTLFGTIGITDRLDVSVSIPIVSTRLSATSNAFINRVAPPDTTLRKTSCPTASVTTGQAHFFDACNPETSTSQTFSNSGSAAGLGDVTFRVKVGLVSRPAVRMAAALDVRIPSGDARKLLGSGAYGYRPFLAISGGQRISPHVNIGYQWNGNSILAAGSVVPNLSPVEFQSNITGVKLDHIDSTSQAAVYATVAQQRLPDQFFYSVGTDMAVSKRLTVVFDYLGQLIIDAPRVFGTSYTSPSGVNFTNTTFRSVTGGVDTMGLNNGAAGIKYNIWKTILLSADLLFRMDNRGLRQDVTPMIALTYVPGR